MRTGDDILREMGLDPEEESKKLATTRKKTAEERIICTCGHSLSRHRFSEGASSSCVPGMMTCPCMHWNPVLKVQDTRPFMWKTSGIGAEHALTKGIIAMNKKNVSGEWLPDAYKCTKCGTTAGVTIYPVQRTGDSLLVTNDYDYASVNLMLCETCKDNI